jgi:hypothetical protein
VWSPTQALLTARVGLLAGVVSSSRSRIVVIRSQGVTKRHCHTLALQTGRLVSNLAGSNAEEAFPPRGFDVFDSAEEVRTRDRCPTALQTNIF